MITELVERHGFATDKTTVHSYGEFYDGALEPCRGRPIRLLEIGVDRGGSLRLWDAYFEGQADIVGVDIDLSRLEATAEWSACFARGDAYTAEMAGSLGDFDVIIDDGPHTLRSQLDLIRLYTPRLKPGGLMVIEDVQDPAWLPRLDAMVPGTHPRQAFDFRHIKGRYDDLLFVIGTPDV